MRTRFIVAVIGVAIASCTVDLGAPCTDDIDKLNDTVEQSDRTNNLVNDPRLENCSAQTSFCLSSKARGLDGSRPYCTGPCISDADCGGAAGFACEAAISFGPLACSDFEDPREEQPRQRGRSSFSPCEVDGDCADVAGEACFTSGDHAGTCGFVGRDCATGDDGALSPHAIKYCTATNGALGALDGN